MSPSGKPRFKPLFSPGLHVITLDELRAMCVDPFTLSATRKPIFDNLLKLISKLTDNNIVGDLWIDGSFVTSKINPRDVDLVVCVSSDLYDNCSAEQLAVFDWFESDELHTDYRCDGYLLIEWPSTHKRHAEGVVARQYWTNFFGHTRDGHEKGMPILQLKRVAHERAI